MAKAKLKAIESSFIQHSGKLDIGCGKSKKEGFTGIDQFAMEGVDHTFDLRTTWPVESDSVEEVHCSHFVEHLTGMERVQFYNELYRVLKKGSKATIIVPHWNSNRAYGDPTHQWPPVSEMAMYYLSKEWRKTQAPHTDLEWNSFGYNCDFEAVWGYGMHPALMTRNQEYQQNAMQWWKEAVQDMHITLTKSKWQTRSNKMLSWRGLSKRKPFPALLLSKSALSNITLSRLTYVQQSLEGSNTGQGLLG